MSGPLLFIVSIIYIIVGIDYALAGNYGLCLCFVAYSIANVGIWFSGAS
jgi:hypothetical protein